MSRFKGGDWEVKSDGKIHRVFHKGQEVDFISRAEVTYTPRQVPILTIEIALPHEQ